MSRVESSERLTGANKALGRCGTCEQQLTGPVNFCSNCGVEVRSEPSPPTGSTASLTDRPTGFGRTLSTELLTKQERLNTLNKIKSLVRCRAYAPGEDIVRQGEQSRDLFLLTEGQAEVSNSSPTGRQILNVISSPYILGDIGCLLGIPRTATVRARSKVVTFILRYDKLKEHLGEFPDWFSPLLSSFVSGIKSLNHHIHTLEQEIETLQPRADERTSGVTRSHDGGVTQSHDEG